MDVQKIIDRVDVDEIVARVDVEEIIERVDVQAIIERVDIEKVIQRVDIDKLVEQTELGTIIAHSTSGVASEVLDVVRSQGVGLDDFVARWVNRILRRNSDDWPPGPPKLVNPPVPVPALHRGGGRMSTPAVSAAPPVAGRQGNYAGAVTRLVAFAADVGASWGIFTVALAGISFAIQLVTGNQVNLGSRQILALVGLIIWEFIYFAYQWSLGGKTIGMAVLGIRVVGKDGDAITPKQAVIRTITLPLSFLLLRPRLPRHPAQQGPARLARPAGQDRGRLLLGRPRRPTAVAGQAGADDARLSGGPAAAPTARGAGARAWSCCRIGWIPGCASSWWSAAAPGARRRAVRGPRGCATAHRCRSAWSAWDGTGTRTATRGPGTTATAAGRCRSRRGSGTWPGGRSSDAVALDPVVADDPAGFAPDVALVNWYGPGAKMGMHADTDEAVPAPVVSFSVGATGVFRFGNSAGRGRPWVDLPLESGDVVVFGGPARLAFHGVPKLCPAPTTRWWVTSPVAST